MDNNYSLADIAAATNEAGCGSNAWILIILFALIFGFGGNGMFGNNVANALGYENLATSAEVQRGFDAQNSMANQREILAAVNSGTAQAVAATNQTFHDTLGIIQSRYDELARDVAGLAVGQAQALANQNECCCSTKMLIQENAAQQRYDSAMQTAQLQQAIQAEGAATRAMIQQDKIEAMQQRINQLELAEATRGMLRYPDSWSYDAGKSPFCPCSTTTSTGTGA